MYILKKFFIQIKEQIIGTMIQFTEISLQYHLSAYFLQASR